MSYTVVYNPDEKVVEIQEGRSSNISGVDCLAYKEALFFRGEINDDLYSGNAEMVKCKDCSNYFIMSDCMQEWFISRGLAQPKRCLTCRQANKIRRMEYAGSKSKNRRSAGVQEG